MLNSATSFQILNNMDGEDAKCNQTLYRGMACPDPPRTMTNAGSRDRYSTHFRPKFDQMRIYWPLNVQKEAIRIVGTHSVDRTTDRLSKNNLYAAATRSKDTMVAVVLGMLYPYAPEPTTKVMLAIEKLHPGYKWDLLMPCRSQHDYLTGACVKAEQLGGPGHSQYITEPVSKLYEAVQNFCNASAL